MPITRKTPPGRVEFIVLMALMSAFVAFSTDAMLPALPEIGNELSPEAPNLAQLVVTTFVAGMGAGTLFAGPLADRFGRRAVVLGGVAIYLAGALLAWWAASLELVLAGRVVQGLGAAGPRVAGLALTRDLYRGREMARIVSYIMMVFALVPAAAPLAGSVIITHFGWRAIFVAFALFVTLVSLWFFLRLPETLARSERRPLAPRAIFAAIGEVLRNPTSRLATLALISTFTFIFATLSSIQPIFDITFARGEAFPYFFACFALISTSAGALNAWLVPRLGIRRVVRISMLALAATSALALGVSLMREPDAVSFWICAVWLQSVFFMVGVSVGNLNALALEPMGHIAGLASSVVSSVSTLGAMLVVIPIGLAFDGTPVPLAAGLLVMALLGAWLVGRIRRPGEDMS